MASSKDQWPPASRAFESVPPGSWNASAVTPAAGAFILKAARLSNAYEHNTAKRCQVYAQTLLAMLRAAAVHPRAGEPPGTRAYARMLVSGQDGPPRNAHMSLAQRALLEFASVVAAYIPAHVRDVFLDEFVVVRVWRGSDAVRVVPQAAVRVIEARSAARRGDLAPWPALLAAASGALVCETHSA
jgi:hypothetical protein